MSVFTEAHFAAALLSCGPHNWSVIDSKACDPATCNSPVHHVANVKYRTRVYGFYVKLFPLLDPGKGHSADWSLFWREYLDWVNP